MNCRGCRSKIRELVCRGAQGAPIDPTMLQGGDEHSTFQTLMKIRFLTDSAHLFVLVGFALAQPLFDLLSKHPEFLVARHQGPMDILLLILALSVCVPLLLVLTVELLGLMSSSACQNTRASFVGALVALIVLPVLSRIDDVPAVIVIGAAVLIGICASASYLRIKPFRTFLTVLSPAALIFPVLFAFALPGLQPQSPAQAGDVHFENNRLSAKDEKDLPPIVMIVFDEFSVTALQNDNQQIDRTHYPNFATLANDAYWFRNATTVADNTPYALPSLLTGRYPSQDQLATARDHPDNLFTVLGDRYELNVVEPVTHLCPESLCPTPKSETDRGKLLGGLVSDLSIVYLHFLLPAEFKERLPSIAHNWKDFDAGETTDLKTLHNRALQEVKKDRAQSFEQFVGSIINTSQPSLYLLHTLLPHGPYNYLPSGKLYGFGSGLDGMDEGKWPTDEQTTSLARQRYLLQVGFVDTLIGKLINRLKSAGLYERALIIITADHGVSFRPNDFRRPLSATNFHDIMSVPLFVKTPYQTNGAIIDSNVQLIDIVPTIYEVLGLTSNQSLDGRSILNEAIPQPREKVIFFRQATQKRTVALNVFEEKRRSALETKVSLFGSGEHGLFRFGPYKDLIGTPTNDLVTSRESEIVTELDQQIFFRDIRVDDVFVPSHITGRVKWKETLPIPDHVAISVNGTLWAVTKPVDRQENEARISAIVPQWAFRSGPNNVEVHTVDTDSRGDVHLAKTQTDIEDIGSYSIAVANGNSETLVSADGESIPIIPDAINGRLDVIHIQDTHMQFAGWAADVAHSELVAMIMIFLADKSFYAGTPNRVNRPDVASMFNDPSLRKAGFSYDFPVTLGEGVTNPNIRVFAVSKRGFASELSHPAAQRTARDRS